MYVRNRMTVNLYTVTPETSINDAFGVMKEHKIKRLLVVSDGKLVGIVTEKELQKVTPSSATTLSVFELNYLLSKAKVSDVMTRNPITIEAKELLEVAAVLMRETDIGALPVTENGELVGIITETDIFDAFIELMGFRDPGSRITVRANDLPGNLSEITSAISAMGVNISHIAVYKGADSVCDVVIRVNSNNSEEIEKALENKGFIISRG